MSKDQNGKKTPHSLKFFCLQPFFYLLIFPRQQLRPGREPSFSSCPKSQSHPGNVQVLNVATWTSCMIKKEKKNLHFLSMFQQAKPANQTPSEVLLSIHVIMTLSIPEKPTPVTRNDQEAPVSATPTITLFPSSGETTGKLSL